MSKIIVVASLCLTLSLPLFSKPTPFLDEYLSEHYQKGFSAWDQNNILQARNHWLRYVELCQRGCGKDKKSQLEEVRFYFEVAGWMLQEGKGVKSKSVIQKIEKKNPPSKRRSKRRPVKKGRTYSQVFRSRAQIESSIKELVGKAHLAHQNGHLEYAHRLYSLALRLNPTSKEIQGKVEMLNKEME